MVSSLHPSQSSFGQAVFDGDDRILARPIRPEADHLFRALLRLVGFEEDVAAVAEHFAGGRVERQGDVFARSIARFFDGLQDQLDGFLIRLEARCEAALIAHPCLVPFLLQDRFQVVEDLDAHPQGVGKILRAVRDDHEFLEVDVVVGMRAAVQDVHHRHGQQAGRDASQVPIERQMERGRRRAGCGHRNGQDGVRAQPALVFRAVESDHLPVDFGLVGGLRSGQLLRDFVDVLHRLPDTFAQVTARVAVAQLQGLMFALEAPEGTAARPALPSRKKTPASTVGFPRESRISLPTIRSIAAISLPLVIP